MRAVSCSEKWLKRWFWNLVTASYPQGFGRLCFFFLLFVGFDRFGAATESRHRIWEDLVHLRRLRSRYRLGKTRVREVSKLFRPIYYKNPILIFTDNPQNPKIILINFLKESNRNRKSDKNSRKSALFWTSTESQFFENFQIEISRQPEIILAKNRDGMYGRGSLFDRRGIFLKETLGISRNSGKRVKNMRKLPNI